MPTPALAACSTRPAAFGSGLGFRVRTPANLQELALPGTAVASTAAYMRGLFSGRA